MTLTLEIPAGVQHELSREAEARGVGVSDLAVTLLSEAVLRAAPSGSSTPARPVEIDEWLDSLAEFSDKIPSMQGETFSRGMIYQDHD